MESDGESIEEEVQVSHSNEGTMESAKDGLERVCVCRAL